MCPSSSSPSSRDLYDVQCLAPRGVRCSRAALDAKMKLVRLEVRSPRARRGRAVGDEDVGAGPRATPPAGAARGSRGGGRPGGVPRKLGGEAQAVSGIGGRSDDFRTSQARAEGPDLLLQQEEAEAEVGEAGGHAARQEGRRNEAGWAAVRRGSRTHLFGGGSFRVMSPRRPASATPSRTPLVPWVEYYGTM